MSKSTQTETNFFFSSFQKAIKICKMIRILILIKLNSYTALVQYAHVC